MADDASLTNTETLPTEAPVEAVSNPTTETPANEGTALGDASTTPAAVEGEPAPDAPSADAAPVVPETYELAAPEGLTLDPANVELAAPVFKELGLTNEQANKLMPVAGEFAKKLQAGFSAQLETDAAAQRASWLTESKADPEIGGAKWDETMAIGARALDQFGSKPFRDFLNASGLGNHPEMLRTFSKIGRAIGEDGFARGDAGAPVKKTDAELFYPKTAA